jgi:hypothetical protein
MSENLPFIDPTAGSGKPRIAPAARPADLAGKTVGLLDNTKEQADVILATLAEELKARYGVARIVMRRKEHYSKPAPDTLIEQMAQEVDVAVAALGG